MVADYDCWHPDHDFVTVDAIVDVLMANAETAKTLIRTVAPRLRDRAEPCGAGCHRALDDAVITHAEARDHEVVRRLDAVAGRILSKEE